MSSRKPRSIMVICNSLGTGGAEKQTVTLVNGLYRRGWSVVLIHLTPLRDLFSELDEGLRDNVICVNRRAYVDLFAVKKIRKLLIENRISTILAVNQLPLVYSVLARALDLKIRVFAGFHTTKLLVKESMIFYLLAWWIFKCATNVVYVCETQKQYWSTRWLHRPNRGMYIYNGVDVGKFNVAEPGVGRECRAALGISDSALVLVSIAMLRPEKRHVDMVSAVRKLVDKGLDVYLLCVGEGSERRVILDLATELDVASRVRMIGRVTDVRPYLAASDMSLILSRAVETFSIAVLESLSCGCPVIAYEVGGIREQISTDDFGRVVPLGNEAELIHEIELLHAKRGTLSKNDIHNYVERRFSAQTMVSNYEKLFLKR